MKITVIAGNGIGGTEKAAFIYAAELAHRGHQVCALTNRTGPRTATLADAGVAIEEVPYDSDSLKRHLADFMPDIVHQHVPGYGDHRALYNALDQIRGARPKVIETNVFGRLMDRYDNGHVSFRMFVSMTSGCQAFQRPRVRRTLPTAGAYSILSNPLPEYAAPSAGRRAAIRSELAVAESEILWIRMGRPGKKWTYWECAAFARARRQNRRLKLLLMEPSPSLAREVGMGRWGDGILIKSASSDFGYLADLYGSADGMIHASDFGESFGYTLAEAMQAGLPIVTLSTPWGDNAQVQLVQHGVNGFVCGSVSGMTRAVLDICTDDGLRTRMSGNALGRIGAISDTKRDVQLLEEIMGYVTGGETGPLMERQFAEWMEFRNTTFEAAQSNLYESGRKLFCQFFKWKAYWKYRDARASLRRALDRRRG